MKSKANPTIRVQSAAQGSRYVPMRVACLQPSATATMVALGLSDRVVACTRHCPAVASGLDLSRVAVVEDSWTAQAIQIAAVKPDLVIASVPYQPQGIAEILKCGARVLALAPRSLQDVYGDIATIASVLDVSERGHKIIRSMQGQIESVRTRTSSAKPRVFCEEWGKPIMTSQPWVAELVEAAGGEFVGEPATKTCAESVRDEDPDVLVFAWCGASERVPMEKMIVEREWEQVRAVRSGRVFVIKDEFLTTPGPPLAMGVLALAHVIHPELFPQVPDSAGRPVLRRMGVD